MTTLKTSVEKIPLVDLGVQHEALREEIRAAVEGTIAASSFILGPSAEAFEKEFAAFLGARRAVGVGNGTDGLELALRAMGVGPGDFVATVPNTFIATTEAITLAGARPVLVDVDEKYFTMDPAALGRAFDAAAAAGRRIKAVIPVHLYGQAADMDAIMDLARGRGALVLEDAAQAHGARWNGRMAGTLGDAAVFSFYPGKNLGACGDAGAVVTQDEALAQKVGLLRNHGRKFKYEHEVEGRNSRLDGIQAAILRVKLKRLADWNAARRRVAAAYDEGLRGLDLVLPARAKEAEHVFHLYVVRSKVRDLLLKNLKEAGIEAGVHYPIPLHLQPAYRYLGHKPGDFPVAERLAGEILSLPMFPELTADQIRRVTEAVRQTLQ